jgi:hypothetical protein
VILAISQISCSPGTLSIVVNRTRENAKFCCLINIEKEILRPDCRVVSEASESVSMYPYTNTIAPNSGYPGASLGASPYGAPYNPMGTTTVYTTTTQGYSPAPSPYVTTTYQRLPGMITVNPYLAVPSMYNRVFYNWFGPYQDPRMPFQVCSSPSFLLLSSPSIYLFIWSVLFFGELR